MFRALLWKEWRELWSLLIAAAALPAITLFFIQSNRRLLNPNVWEMAFSFWLFVAAILIPILLYVREKDTGAAHFLSPRPLDRFRLWWFRLAICLTLLIAAAFVLYGTITVLTLFHAKAKTYELRKDEIVWSSLRAAVFFFSLSIFMSSFFRRQIAAVTGIVILVSGCWMIWTIVSAAYEPLHVIKDFFSDAGGNRPLLFLGASPPLLLAGLLAYARDDLPRRTKTLALLTYIPLGIMTCFASGAAAVSLSGPAAVSLAGRLQELVVIHKPFLRIQAVSPDGNHVLVVSVKLKAAANKELFSIDMKRREAHLIDRNYLSHARFGLNNSIMYIQGEGHGFLSKSALVFSDFDGTNRKTVSKNPSSLTAFSSNSDYAAAILGDSYEAKKAIAFFDPNGKMKGKYEAPPLETDVFLYPTGWDYKGRFYFWKGFQKRNRFHSTYWRISGDNMKPERVDFIPAAKSSYLSLSADGRWMTRRAHVLSWQDSPSSIKSNQQLWLYNIEKQSGKLLTNKLFSCAWAPGGSTLVWSEAADTEKDKDERLSRVVFYDADTGAESPVSFEGVLNVKIMLDWSPAGERLLLLADKKKSEFAVLSLPDRKIVPLYLQKWVWPPKWVSGERLLWSVDDSLRLCDADSSNEKEFVRFEKGKLIFK
jgi:hypothetical protein